MTAKIIKAGRFQQACRWCRTLFEFHYADTYVTHDYTGDANDGRYVKCPSCKQGQRALVP